MACKVLKGDFLGVPGGEESYDIVGFVEMKEKKGEEREGEDMIISGVILSEMFLGQRQREQKREREYL